MTSSFIFTMGILLFASHSAWAVQPPQKIIQPTLYCSQINRLDEAIRLLPEDVVGLKADRLVVSKTRKKLYLLHAGQIISEYSVSFGFGFKEGPKFRRGDGRTPEGLYEIDLKKSRTAYHLALEISYPSESDVNFARRLGLDPGGDILIHGFPSYAVDGLDPTVIPNVHKFKDWTQGCIAVTNQEIEEIFTRVDAQTPIEICPFE